MTYNKLTGDCVCKCNFAWKSRTKNPPVKCPSCGSRAWQSNTRSFSCIICRAGIQDEKTGTRSFSIIDFIDSPAVTSEDIFYISKKDLEMYFAGRSPPGSGIIIIGSFEIGEDLLLKIKSMTLVYCHEATFRSYVSTVSCLYNIKSFYQKQAALKQYNEDQLLKEQMEDAKKEATIEAARARLNAARARDLKALEAEKILEDSTVSNSEKMEAIKLLRR